MVSQIYNWANQQSYLETKFNEMVSQINNWANQQSYFENTILVRLIRFCERFLESGKIHKLEI